MNQDAWHYVVGGSSRGPHSTLEMEGLIARGGITAQTLVWNETLPQWEPAAQHFDFRGVPVAGPGEAPQGGIGRDGLYAGAPSRGFVEALQVCFAKFVTFSGRASRSELWFFVLWQALIGTVTSVIDLGLVGPTGFSLTNTAASLILFLPSLAVSVRRLHDIDRSGWWIGGFYIVILLAILSMGASGFMLLTGGGTDPDTIDTVGVGLVGILGLVILVYSIVLIVFFCLRGTLGPNRYG